jgi:hypothetical protein
MLKSLNPFEPTPGGRYMSSSGGTESGWKESRNPRFREIRALGWLGTLGPSRSLN